MSQISQTSIFTKWVQISKRSFSFFHVNPLFTAFHEILDVSLRLKAMLCCVCYLFGRLWEESERGGMNTQLKVLSPQLVELSLPFVTSQREGICNLWKLFFFTPREWVDRLDTVLLHDKWNAAEHGAFSCEVWLPVFCALCIWRRLSSSS